MFLLKNSIGCRTCSNLWIKDSVYFLPPDTFWKLTCFTVLRDLIKLDTSCMFCVVSNWRYKTFLIPSVRIWDNFFNSLKQHFLYGRGHNFLHILVKSYNQKFSSNEWKSLVPNFDNRITCRNLSKCLLSNMLYLFIFFIN